MNFLQNLRIEIDDDSKKKIFLFGGIVLGIIVLIIIISVIVSIINKKTPYQEVEHIMEKAAYNYLKDNNELLPSETNPITSINADVLVEQEYMKKIKKYTKNDSCTGEVVVTYKNSDYSYQAYLTCNDFKTTLLVDKIKQDNQFVAGGDGLYNEVENLRFRGEYVNNYIKFGNINYRILKIDADNKIYITPEDMDDRDEKTFVYWDDRYNSEEDSSSGISDYNLSRIKRSLDGVYESFDNSLKNNITTHSACIGKRDYNNFDNSGNIECSEKLEDVKISLLPIYEYIKASVAPACKSPASRECKNYNYLIIKEASWWTLTGDSSNTSRVYYVSTTGEIGKDKCNNKKLSRYVVALKSGVLYNSGDGTLKSPYTIR